MTPATALAVSMTSAFAPTVIDLPRHAEGRDRIYAEIRPDEPKTVALVGGLGAVVQRFLAESFAAGKDRFDAVRFTIVDTLPAPGRERLEELRKLGLPLAERPYITSTEFDSWLHDKARGAEDDSLRIDAAYLATPTCWHFPQAVALCRAGVKVAVEKPLCHPDHLAGFRSALSGSGMSNSLFAVDFMSDSQAVIAALHNPAIRGHLEQLLPLHSIHGKLVESVPLPESRRWVFTRAKNGGGAGLDVLPHVVNGIEAVLRRVALSLADASIERAVSGRYSIRGVDAPGDGETYLRFQGNVSNGRGQRVPVLMEGGRLAGETYFGFTLNGAGGSLEFFTGSEASGPYIRWSSTGGESVLYRITGSGVGYDETWFNFLTFVYGARTHEGISPPERLETGLIAVDLIDRATKIAGIPLPYDFHDPAEILRTGAHDVPRPSGAAIVLQRLVE